MKLKQAFLFANAAALLDRSLSHSIEKSAACSNRRAVVCLHSLFTLGKSFIIFLISEGNTGQVRWSDELRNPSGVAFCGLDEWISGCYRNFLSLSFVSVVHFLGEQIGGTVTSLCSIKMLRPFAKQLLPMTPSELEQSVWVMIFGEEENSCLFIYSNFGISTIHLYSIVQFWEKWETSWSKWCPLVLHIHGQELYKWYCQEIQLYSLL